MLLTKKILFFDLKRVYQSQSKEILAIVKKTLDSGWYILGQQNEILEKKLLTTVGNLKGHYITCNSGTDALKLALIAGGIGVGDEVITVSHTAVPTVTAIISTGAAPVFIDIHPQTWVMDTALIEAAVTTKTKAIIPVHLYGNMVDIFEIKKILKKINREDILIIEDVAQAHGSFLNGQGAGTIGDFGCFSFYPTKNLGALGDAGAIYTNSAEAAEKLKMLRNYGQASRYNAKIERGLNSRLDEIQAAILQVRLKKFNQWNKLKTKLMNAYRKAFTKQPISFQQLTKGCVPAWHLGVIALEDNAKREALKNYLEEQGIQTLIHYPTFNHLHEAFKKYSRKLPVTENLAARMTPFLIRRIMVLWLILSKSSASSLV
jgi:dTDP-4-amino-4,6-dideoxygalactose transaminase